MGVEGTVSQSRPSEKHTSSTKYIQLQVRESKDINDIKVKT